MIVSHGKAGGSPLQRWSSPSHFPPAPSAVNQGRLCLRPHPQHPCWTLTFHPHRECRNLGMSGLKGPVAWEELAKLSALTSLDLETNELSGPFGPLPPNVLELLAQDNEFNGTLPLDWQLPSVLEVCARWQKSTEALAMALFCGKSCRSHPTPHFCFPTFSPNNHSTELPPLFFAADHAHCIPSLHTQRLRIDYNHLHGPLPAGLFRSLPRLALFAADNNHLTGTLPPDLHLPGSLKLLTLGSNRLRGALPPTFQFGQLEMLHLGDNLVRRVLGGGHWLAVSVTVRPAC